MPAAREQSASHPSDFPALRTIACGAGHLSDGLIKELKTLFPHTAIQPIYGLTETTSPATIFPGDVWGSDKCGSSGQAIRGSSLPSATIASSPPRRTNRPYLAKRRCGDPRILAAQRATPELRCAGLVLYRRSRLSRRRRLAVHQRPQQGHDQSRRRENLLTGAGKHLSTYREYGKLPSSRPQPGLRRRARGVYRAGWPASPDQRRDPRLAEGQNRPL
ncbi:AMP-binding protein [Klebsiella pneumoniae]|uniref:AMP-binding protein n=1 Tax=Klebsiella pneumoniae TaxID=573 RepID=A0A939SMZ9_KLEPN|nr:AMP-binding protein [Klebsiella pneumoniae]